MKAATANIKNELAGAFPETCFSFKTPFFSRERSLIIRWSGKPTERQVREIAGKYDDKTASEASRDLFGSVTHICYERENPSIDMQMELFALNMKELRIKTQNLRKVASESGVEIFVEENGKMFLKKQTGVIYHLNLDEDEEKTDPKEILKSLIESRRSFGLGDLTGIAFLVALALALLLIVLGTLESVNEQLGKATGAADTLRAQVTEQQATIRDLSARSEPGGEGTSAGGTRHACI